MSEFDIEAIFAILFGCAWVVGMASWFFGIAEMIAVSRFSGWAYRCGVKVLDDEITLRGPIGLAGSELEFDHSIAKIISSQEIYFRPKTKMFDFKTIQTPFPVKSILTRKSAGYWRIEGRIPISTTLFILAWLTGWSVGGIVGIIESGIAMGAPFLAVGWMFAVGMVVFSLPLEKRRAKKTIAEIENVINQPAQLA